MNDAAEPPSPWSSDEVPVSSPPTAVVWNYPTTTADRAVPPDEGVDSTDAERDEQTSRRPVVIGLLSVVALVVVGLLVWPRDSNDDSVGAPPVRSDAPVTTLGTLPERADDDADESGNPDDDSGGPDTSEQSDGSERTLQRIDLPAPVAANVDPTELIVQSTDGTVHTISLPSGSVRSVDLGTTNIGDGFGGGSMIAGPDAAMVSTFGTTVIVPRSGVPVVIDRAQFGDGASSDQVSPYGWVTGASGETLFVVAVYDPTDDSQASFLITTDGIAAAPSAATFSNFSFPIAAQGVQIVNDAGGAYRLDVDGTAERLTDGTVIGASQTEALVRRCDAERTCQFVVRPIDASDGSPAERVIDIPDSLGSRYYGVSLSPDGTAISFTRYGGSPQRVIVELESGDTIEGGTGDFGSDGAWARDGSGEFTSATGQGITYLERTSGDSFVFGEELGQVSAIAARYPESELIDSSIPTSPVGFSTPPASEIGIDLLTTGRIGVLALIDLDAATASSWNAPSTPGSNPATIIVDGPTALVLSSNSESGYLATYGTAQELAENSLPERPISVGPDGLGLWTRNVQGASDIDQIAVTIDGGPIRQADESTLVVDNATLIGDDGAGSIVFERGGSIYATTGEEPVLLTSGELIALGTSAVLVRECGELLACRLEVIDRESGERTPVGSDSVLDFAEAATEERDVSLAGSMSPDAGIAMVSLGDLAVVDADGEQSDETWGVVDLATSDVITIDAPDTGQPIIWNADSSYAAFASGGSILLYERSTRSVIEVTGVADVRSLAAIGPEFAPAASGES